MALTPRVAGFVVGLAVGAGCGSKPSHDDRDGGGVDGRPPPSGPGLPWSHDPPGGRLPSEVPQLVAITFDDNFGLASPGAIGGVTEIVQFLRDRRNPAGGGNPDDFDGTPAHVTFYHTSIYAVDASQLVLGGKHGEDRGGRCRTRASTSRRPARSPVSTTRC